MRHIRSQTGVSLIEVMIACAVIGILSVILSNFYADSLIDFTRNESKILIQNNTKIALENLTRDIKNARTVETTNQYFDGSGITFTTKNDGSVDSNGIQNTLVLSVPSRDSNDNLLFKDPIHTSACVDNVIFYIKSGVLYRRTIKNTEPAATTDCENTRVTNGESVLIDSNGVLQLNFYTNDNTNIGSIPPGSAPSAGLLELTVRQSRTKFSRTYTSELTGRVSVRNN